ncbi:SLATT domain-containing protein [Rhizobium leguminosarum bv. viciae]|nr:SLATT domain-containing protein [Rhizobium leguminosarum bv. viciae]
MTLTPQNSFPTALAPTSKTLDYYQYLAEKIIPGTRGARFTAARLLILKERASLLIQTVLAVVLIWVSVMLLADRGIDETVTRQLAIVSTMSSVAILAITLFEYALGRGLLAAKLHDSSLRVTGIMRRLERELASPQPSLTVLDTLAEEYEQENIATNVNHSAVDFAVHKYSRAQSDCWVLELFYRSRSIIAQALFVALAVSPGLLTLIVICYQARDLPFTGVK